MMRAGLVIKLNGCCDLCNVHAKIARARLKPFAISTAEIAYKQVIGQFEIGAFLEVDYMDRTDQEKENMTMAMPDTDALLDNISRGMTPKTKKTPFKRRLRI